MYYVYAKLAYEFIGYCTSSSNDMLTNGFNERERNPQTTAEMLNLLR